MASRTGLPSAPQPSSWLFTQSFSWSWSVLSGAAEPARARQAMEAVRANLVKEDARLILLFTPPINKTRRDPGYIKGYPPGVRENGGQYTHAALWSIWAWTELGDGDLAQSLFQLINPITRADSLIRSKCRVNANGRPSTTLTASKTPSPTVNP